MARDFRPLADAIQYFEEIGPELFELEKKIKKIKQNKLYRKHSNTLNTYKSRGIVDTAPVFKNGYKLPTEVEINGTVQTVEDFLKKILDKTE